MTHRVRNARAVICFPEKFVGGCNGLFS